MNKEIKLRELSLKLIVLLVWFEFLWAIVFVIGIVFKWSGLTSQLTTAFFSAGFAALILLAAVSLLNFAVNLNIISISKSEEITDSSNRNSKIGIKTPIAISSVIILLVIGGLWIAEVSLYHKKVAEAKSRIEFIGSNQKVDSLISMIEVDTSNGTFISTIKKLEMTTPNSQQFSLIFPKTIDEDTVMCEISYWNRYSSDSSDSVSLSESDHRKFVPQSDEKKKFEKLINNEITFFAVPRGNSEISAFHRIDTEKGFVILNLETNRRSEYSKGSF